MRARLEQEVFQHRRTKLSKLADVSQPAERVNQRATGAKLERLHANTTSRSASQALSWRMREPLEEALEVAVADRAVATAGHDERSFLAAAYATLGDVHGAAALGALLLGRHGHTSAPARVLGILWVPRVTT